MGTRAHRRPRATIPIPAGFSNAWVDRTPWRTATSGSGPTPPATTSCILVKAGAKTRPTMARSATACSPSPAACSRPGRKIIASTRVFLPCSKSGPAVVVLPQWNAKWDVQVKICLWLNRLGITALRLSMPYHDRRAIPGHERADHLVGPNIGLTLQANRQAVLDVRRCLHMARAAGLRQIGAGGHKHRLGGRIHHHGARSAGARRSFPARLHLFCRRGAHGNEHGARLGRLAHQRQRRRTAAILVADQSVSVRADACEGARRKC